MPTPATTIDVDGFEVRLTNPDKVLFPAIGVTKMELVEYYLTVADAALIGCRDRPTIMHRFPNGVDGEPFYQKRVPSQRPPWVQTATITFPSGRHAVMIAPADAAHLVWMANLACLDLNPWPVRCDDVDHPDELRVDLDPTPGVPWDDVRKVTLVVRQVLEDHGAVGFPATSGKRGMHLVVPIVREHGFTTVRRAALALAREVTRRTRAASRPPPGGRKSGRASSSTTTRTHGIARSRRCTRFGRFPMRASRRRCRGTRCRTSTHPSSRSARSRTASRRSATRERRGPDRAVEPRRIAGARRSGRGGWAG